MADEEGADDFSEYGKPTCCETKVQVSKCCIVWSVQNFTYCRQVTGQNLSSCIFSDGEPGGLKFRLDFFPKGTKEAPDDLVVSLRLVTDASDVRALIQYSCFIYTDGDKKKNYLREGEKVLVPGSYNQDIPLLKRQEFLKRKKELFPNDIVVLCCAVRSSHKEDTGTKVISRSML